MHDAKYIFERIEEKQTDYQSYDFSDKENDALALTYRQIRKAPFPEDAEFGLNKLRNILFGNKAGVT